MNSKDSPGTDGPTKEEMCRWDLASRKARISKIYIKHPGVQKIRATLDLAYETGIRQREASTSYIIGNSRCGKSETLKRFIAERSGVPFPDREGSNSQFIDGPKARIVYLDCNNGATPLQASQSMLAKHFDYRVLRLSQSSATENLVEMFRRDKVAMLVIDEGQKLMNGLFGKGAEDMINWILSLENSGLFRIIVAGTRELEHLLTASETLRDRKFADVALEPFAFRTEAQKQGFGRFLRAFDKDMPFLSTPLSDRRFDEAFYFATRGRPGTLAKFMELAAALAVRRCKDGPAKTIEKEDLIEAFEMQLLREERMQNINPFTHEGALPTFPLTLAEEDEERSLLTTNARPKRQRASRITHGGK